MLSNEIKQKFPEIYGSRQRGFYCDLEQWRADLLEKHPTIRIEVIGEVHRAYLGKTKVAVFGNYEDFGFITSIYIGSLLYGKDDDQEGNLARSRKYKPFVRQ